MKLLNLIAHAVLSRLAARAPSFPPGTEGAKPPVWRMTIVGVDGSPYLTRVHFPRVLGVRPMLHYFHRPDEDREHHNHPWREALSIILAGSYVEERVLPDESRLAMEVLAERRVVKWWNYLTDQDYHRVSELRGHVWTLFVAGERVQDWGFLLDDGSHLPWQEFLARRVQ